MVLRSRRILAVDLFKVLCGFSAGLWWPLSLLWGTHWLFNRSFQEQTRRSSCSGSLCSFSCFRDLCLDVWGDPSAHSKPPSPLRLPVAQCLPPPLATVIAPLIDFSLQHACSTCHFHSHWILLCLWTWGVCLRLQTNKLCLPTVYFLCVVFWAGKRNRICV